MTKCPAFAWSQIAFGRFIAVVSPIVATRESQRRLHAWAEHEISRDEDVISWSPKAARIARLVAINEILEQDRAPTWKQVASAATAPATWPWLKKIRRASRARAASGHDSP